ncbi:hypothetical protein ACFL6U_03755 [Planctomycetota bacterium]
MARKSISPYVESAVLTASARRCAFCFGIDHDYTEKAGQIAHVDQDSSNPSFENLAWLCLEHHDRYDGATSQSKGLTRRELEEYREKLYEEVQRNRTTSSTQLPDLKSKMKRDESEPFHWKIEGETREGPYCSNCWEDRKKKISLNNPRNGVWTCPACNNTIKDSSWHTGPRTAKNDYNRF